MNKLNTFLTLLFLSISSSNFAQQIDSISDYDGNVYQTLIIGNQEWMTENLKTTHYSDGETITIVENNIDWDNLGFGDKAFCYYDNNNNGEANTYGALYNWLAAMNGDSSSNKNPSDVQGVCPANWHLPSDNEWKELEIYLGMSQLEADATLYRGTNQGSKLAGNDSLWTTGNLTNDVEFENSGFSVLPGGHRDSYGIFGGLNLFAPFWTSTEANNFNAWDRAFDNNYTEVIRYKDDKTFGRYIRCVKDLETSIKHIDKDNSIIIFPNPSRNSINIILPNNSKSFVTIYTTEGKFISTHQISRDRSKLNIEGIQRGIYILKIQYNKKVIFKKLVIE